MAASIVSASSTASLQRRIVTANRRLARRLQRDGLDAITLDDWLDSLLKQTNPNARMLQPFQSALLWQETIAATTQQLPVPFANLAATADVAMQAWSLCHNFQLSWKDPDFAANAETSQFQTWADAYSRRLSKLKVEDRSRALSRLPDEIWTSPPLDLRGFDRLTPLQLHLVGRVDFVTTDLDHPAERQSRQGFASFEEELRAAALWAQQQVEAGQPCAIIVPTLSTQANEVRRILRSVLSPHEFELSSGTQLGDVGIIHDALQLLDLLDGRATLDTWSWLLRSNYVGGAQQDSGRRALFDAWLRDRAGQELSVETVLRFETRAPIHTRSKSFFDSLRRTAKQRAKANEQLSFSNWKKRIHIWLNEFGWAEESTLSSEEFQAREAWLRQLDEWAQLDLVSPPVGWQKAFALLKRKVNRAPFQPESKDAPVQVMGLLESAGSIFKALWVVGNSDNVWPPPVRPHPFLPVGKQRQRKMPNSSAEVQAQYAAETTARLQRSANEIVFSWPQRDRDAELQPSPMIASIAAAQADPANVGSMDADSVELRRRPLDWQAPALPLGFQAAGGSHALKDQAGCPFRSFARFRLQARELEEPSAAFTPRDRGDVMHRVLERFWREVKSHAALIQMEDQQWQDLLADYLKQGLDYICAEDDQPWQLGLREVEEAILQQRLCQWIVIEKQRTPFQVVDHERKLPADIGGIQFEVRIDRVDQVSTESADNGKVIIDYKSGKFSIKSWEGERLDEPQVPLYASLYSDAGETVVGALVANLRPEELQLRGLVAYPESAQVEGNKMTVKAMGDQIQEWRHHLTQLAIAHRNGDAQLDPKRNTTCQYCHLPTLCRKAEVLRASETDEAAE
jgi:ATP-dependent helicase/nuclease subunit B